MTPLILLDDLCIFLQAAVQEFRLETKEKGPRPPSVWPGYLPNDNTLDDDEVFPYVIARLIGTEDTDKGSVAKVAILIGTYSEDGQFWRDCLNVGQRIRQQLLINRTLASRFRLQLPLRLDTPESVQQPYPEAVCWLTTTWVIPQPQERLEEGIYGETIPGHQ